MKSATALFIVLTGLAAGEAQAESASGWDLPSPKRLLPGFEESPGLRSLPRKKLDAKRRTRAKPDLGRARLGLKLQAGFGGGIALPEGPGFTGHAALGIYFDHVAVLGAFEVLVNRESGVAGGVVELEIYRSSRRRDLDPYWILGGGMAAISEFNEGNTTSSALGPAGVFGFGVNLIGGEATPGGGSSKPYFALHARLPVMAYITPEGAGLALIGTLVLEIAYQ